MKTIVSRPYRKNLNSIGVLTFSGAEYAFLALNISTTGLLAKLVGETDVSKFSSVSLASSVNAQLDLPEMSFSCVCEIIRVEKRDETILLALRFDEESMNVDGAFNRHNLENIYFNKPGLLTVDGKDFPGRTLYLSDQTLIAILNEHTSLEAGREGIFKSEEMEKTVKANISWIDNCLMAGTLICLNNIKYGYSG